MAMAAVERSVLRIDRPEVQQGMTPQHRVRPLMPAAMRRDFAATDPFLAHSIRCRRTAIVLPLAERSDDLLFGFDRRLNRRALVV